MEDLSVVPQSIDPQDMQQGFAELEKFIQRDRILNISEWEGRTTEPSDFQMDQCTFPTPQFGHGSSLAVASQPLTLTDQERFLDNPQSKGQTAEQSDCLQMDQHTLPIPQSRRSSSFAVTSQPMMSTPQAGVLSRYPQPPPPPSTMKRKSLHDDCATSLQGESTSSLDITLPIYDKAKRLRMTGPTVLPREQSSQGPSLLPIPRMSADTRPTVTSHMEGFVLEFTSEHFKASWQESSFLTVPDVLNRTKLSRLRLALDREPATEVRISLGMTTGLSPSRAVLQCMSNIQDSTGTSDRVSLRHTYSLAYWPRIPQLLHSPDDPSEALHYAPEPLQLYEVDPDASRFGPASEGTTDIWANLGAMLVRAIASEHDAPGSNVEDDRAKPQFRSFMTPIKDDILRSGKVTASSALRFQKEDASILMRPSYFPIDGKTRETISEALNFDDVYDLLTVTVCGTETCEMLPPSAAIVVNTELRVDGVSNWTKTKLAEILQGPDTRTIIDSNGRSYGVRERKCAQKRIVLRDGFRGW